MKVEFNGKYGPSSPSIIMDLKHKHSLKRVFILQMVLLLKFLSYNSAMLNFVFKNIYLVLSKLNYYSFVQSGNYEKGFKRIFCNFL